MALGTPDRPEAEAHSGGGVCGYPGFCAPPGASRSAGGYRGTLAYRSWLGSTQADQRPWERLISRKLKLTVATVVEVIRGSRPHPEPREAREGTEAP